MHPSSRTRHAGFTRFIADLRAGIREGRDIQRRYDGLRHLSNTDLARRGLTRDGIIRAALTGS